MRTTEYDRINERIGREHFVDPLLHKIVCSWTARLIVFHQRHPHGTSYARYFYIRMQLGYFKVVGMRADGARSGKNAHMTSLGNLTYTLSGRAYNTEHPERRVYLRKVVLLYCAQCLGRCGITSKDSQRTAFLKQTANSLQGELVDYIKTAGTVWSACIIAQIKVVVLRHELADCPQHGQSAISAVKNSYWRRHYLGSSSIPKSCITSAVRSTARPLRI